MTRDGLETLLLTRSRSVGSRLRVLFYRWLGLNAGRRNRLERIRCRRLSQITMGEGNALSEGCWLWPQDSRSDTPRIVIGDGNYFNRDVMLDACNRIVIGNRNMLGPGVYVTDANHGFDGRRAPGEAPVDLGTVHIGDNCWIGARAVILKDVELGDNCVVAAGAVVTKSVPPRTLVAGVPARPVRALG